MYNWRRLTPEQRVKVLRCRQRCGQPWHGPPHSLEKCWYHVSAACYEHRKILGVDPRRIAVFERELHTTLAPVTEAVSAWCILPNHYHVLVQAVDLPSCRKALGTLHGRSAHDWDLKDGKVGRRCWHRCLPKPLKSERHRWATMNYIHHNPVHHGYTAMWKEWPFCSAPNFLEAVGERRAREIWKEYPILEFGVGWDEPNM